MNKEPHIETQEDKEKEREKEEIKEWLENYVREHNIMRVIDLEMKLAMLYSETEFLRNVDTITDEQIERLVEDEQKTVSKLMVEKLSWILGYCDAGDRIHYRDENYRFPPRPE